MKEISKGICAAPGFTAGAIHSGVRANQTKEDLAIIYSDVPCVAAGVYTTNKVKAAPLKLTKSHLENGVAQAVIVNSGNANACAPHGMENALIQAQAAATKLGIDVEDVIVASTGVIGQDLPIDKIVEGTKKIVLTEDGSATAKAIMTTDTKVKEAAIEFELGGKLCHMGGIAKGSGMIHPNMGTMLCFITTDANIARGPLQTSLKANTKITFNHVSVDGDTSTNDMCVVLSNGKAGNAAIETTDSAEYAQFNEALHYIMEKLAKMIASDGEGATRLLTVKVLGASTESQAETLAMSVVSSSLFKAAIFGADANWGRVLCALGYADTDFDPDTVDISFVSKAGTIPVCAAGKGLDFDEDLAKKILSQPEVETIVNLHEGGFSATCWGCDLTYDYVRINGDYRS